MEASGERDGVVTLLLGAIFNCVKMFERSLKLYKHAGALAKHDQRGIIVLNDGKIIEDGNLWIYYKKKIALSKRCGAYKIKGLAIIYEKIIFYNLFCDKRASLRLRA